MSSRRAGLWPRTCRLPGSAPRRPVRAHENGSARGDTPRRCAPTPRRIRRAIRPPGARICHAGLMTCVELRRCGFVRFSAGPSQWYARVAVNVPLRRTQLTYAPFTDRPRVGSKAALAASVVKHLERSDRLGVHSVLRPTASQRQCLMHIGQMLGMAPSGQRQNMGVPGYICRRGQLYRVSEHVPGSDGTLADAVAAKATEVRLSTQR